MSNAFRSEIAGLRAIAVAGVVLFHLKVTGVQGGFVGVDVFFVISGYLITRNLLGDIEAGRFSLSEFYVRRTRRIYPALIFTVLATYLAGALWCSPQMFLDLAKESTHAILSIANIQYWREANQYFAPLSEHLALLHCWSLSLEEQFYLFWPALILLASKSGRPFAIVALVAAASLAAAIIVSRSDPSAAFFLTPFRIFEFAIGALVLAAERRAGVAKSFSKSGLIPEVLSAVGMVSILAGLLLFHPEMSNAAAASLVPCIGAALVIFSGGATWTARLLTNRAATSLGAVSYSLYLCHWPILFFGRFIFGEAAEGVFALSIMLAVMLLVAIAMYQLIERRFLHDPRSAPANFAKNFVSFASIMLMIAALTHATFVAKGFAWRLPQDQAELAYLEGVSYRFGIAQGADHDQGPVKFALVGDSFASQYLPGLAALLGELKIGADLVTLPGCPLLHATIQGRHEAECERWHEQTLADLQNSDLPVILAQRWENYTDGMSYLLATPATGSPLERLQTALETTLARLTKNGRRILIIGDQVRAGCAIDVPRVLSGPLPHAPVKPCPASSREAAEQASAAINRVLENVQAKWPEQVSLLRPVDYFCDADCPVVKDGIWLYCDSAHFSVAGSQYMVERSKAVFREFLAGPPPPPPRLQLRADRS
jgi:peptidoglycan/LPS O-acetylase OafA/YrhL